MKYEHTPRPLVEEHYHIKELIERQEKRTDDRIYHREKEKEREENEKLIKEAKQVCVTEFWCDKCKQDFKSMSIKEVESDWNNPSHQIAFYRSKCDKGHWCQRLITDKHTDAFWTKSKLVARDKGLHINDIIQPHETGFNLLYGRPR